MALRSPAAAVVLSLFLASCSSGNAGRDLHAHEPLAALREQALARSWTADTTLFARGPMAALPAADSNGNWHLLLAETTSSDVRLIGEPFQIGGYRPVEMRWVTGLPVTEPVIMAVWNYPSEEIVATYMWQIRSGSAERIYAEADVCKPAQVIDVDNAEPPELLTYAGDRTYEDLQCNNFLCYEALLERFDVPPVWVAVSAWSGEGWTAAASGYESFYQRLAERYARAARWIASEDAEGVCADYRDPSALEQLAQRAQDRANHN